MVQMILTMLRDASARSNRAVVLVPEAAYEEALRGLLCIYPENSGRTAMMTNGQLVSVLTPSAPISDMVGSFDLYLSNWGMATPQEEKSLSKWTGKADTTYLTTVS
jgi:hypothetical protein